MTYKALTEENCKDFKNFKYSEVACKCKKYCNGYPVPFSYELMRLLQDIRNHFGSAIIITSAIRCTQHNKNVGGVTNSKHLKGWATDFYVKGVSYSKLVAYVKTLPYIRYYYNVSGSVMHLDIMPPEEDNKYNLKRLLKKGCKGDDVKKLQQALGGLNVDGIFGNKTKSKVIELQKNTGIARDGIVGKNTAHKLGWLYNGK